VEDTDIENAVDEPIAAASPTAEATVVERPRDLPPTGASIAGEGRPVVLALAVVISLALVAVAGNFNRRRV
jgi:hypothetical protein